MNVRDQENGNSGNSSIGWLDIDPMDRLSSEPEKSRVIVCTCKLYLCFFSLI